MHDAAGVRVFEGVGQLTGDGDRLAHRHGARGWNLASRSGSVATSGGSTMRATSRLSRVSLARYTSPMPPAPSEPSTS